MKTIILTVVVLLFAMATALTNAQSTSSSKEAARKVVSSKGTTVKTVPATKVVPVPKSTPSLQSVNPGDPGDGDPGGGCCSAPTPELLWSLDTPNGQIDRPYYAVPATPAEPEVVLTQTPNHAFSTEIGFSDVNRDINCKSLVIANENKYFVGCNGRIYKVINNHTSTILDESGSNGAYNWGLAYKNGILYATGYYVNIPQYYGFIQASSDDGAHWVVVENSPGKVFTSIGMVPDNTDPKAHLPLLQNLFDGMAIGATENSTALDGEAALLWTPRRFEDWQQMSVTGLYNSNYGNGMSGIYNKTLGTFDFITAGIRVCRGRSTSFVWSCDLVAGGQESQANDVSYDGQNRVWMVGGIGTTFGWSRFSTDGGYTFSSRQVYSTMPYNNVHCDKDLPQFCWITAGNLDIAGSTGKLIQSSDSGTTWTLSNNVLDKMGQCDSYRYPNSSQTMVKCIGTYYNSTGNPKRVGSEIWSDIMP